MRMIPGSPFRFRNPNITQLITNSERKKKGNGRINVSFLCKTPNLKDKKIQEYIKKFPVKEKEPEEKNEIRDNYLAMRYK